MIQNKSHRTWLISFLISGIGLIFSASDQEDTFIEYLKSQFNKYNSGYPVERTYLMTDRFVYRPGEDLWFKGYVVSGYPKINSKDFFIRLISDRGDEIIYRRYPLSENETSGRLVIPRSCIPGKYWLIAYTGWMRNRCPEEAFRKEILVSKYYERRFQVEPVFDKSIYFSGDTLRTNIRIIDPSGRPVSETQYDYSLETFRKTVYKGSGNTDIKGKSKISFVLPESDELLMLTIEIRSRKISGNYSMIIPSPYGKTSVRFYPEGGALIADLQNRMAVKTSDQYGIPRQIKGALTDRFGNIIDTISTGADGKGIIEFVPVADSMYLLLVHHGNIIKYALPPVRSEGSLIHYLGRDGDAASFRILSKMPGKQRTYWLGVINNKIVWSSTEDFSYEKLIQIPVKDFPGGILQVSVFGEDFKLIGERLIKLSNNELHVQMERNLYRNRQRVSVLVEYPGKLKESSLALSVSLYNVAHHPNAESFQEVFNSGSCLDEVDGITSPKNDIDLIAADYYPVNWDEILNYPGNHSEYKNSDGLNGTVYDKKENIAPHAKVRITHFPNWRLYETQTDENGRFRISFGSEIIDYKFLNVDAYDALGKTSLSPRIDYSYIEELQNSILNDEHPEKERATDLQKFGEPDLVYDLRYGPGKFRKSRTDARKKYDPYQYANYTDVMDIIQDIHPYRLADNKIIFLERNRSDSAAMPEAIIVINGALKGTNAGVLKTILPSDITNINISDALLDIRKYTPLLFGSVIEITTIQGMSRYSQSHIQTGQGMLNTDREFYSPDYSVESSYSADNRKTLYWNSKLSPYKGNSMVVTFYTSDLKGTFYGHVTGLDNEGNPVEKTFSFRVE